MARERSLPLCLAAVFTVTVAWSAWRGLTDLKNLPEGCVMTYMYPNYVPINTTSGNMLEAGVASAGKYGLFLYAEGWKDVNFEESLRRLAGVPVLFIPGNAGSYKQVRSMASESARQFESGFTPSTAPIPTTLPRAVLEGARKCSGKRCEYASRLDWFEVDFLEEYSALDSRILQDQTEFVVKAIEKILDLYKQSARFRRIRRGGKHARQLPANVILFGHSMGGVVARAALFHPAFRERSVKTIVTLATLHRSPPVPIQLSGSLFYSNLNRKWREGFAETGPLRDVIVVSVSGGSRDTQVRTPLTRLDGIVTPRNGFSVSASAVPDVWQETDHQVIVWCNQLVVKLSKALLLLSDPATGQPHDSRVVRREILAAHLRSTLPEALGWLPRGSRMGDPDPDDVAEIQPLMTREKGTRINGEEANRSEKIGKRKATSGKARDGAGVLEAELEKESENAVSSKSGTRLGPGNVFPLKKESKSRDLRGEAEGRESERGTTREEIASNPGGIPEKERNGEKAERERNDEKAEREWNDGKAQKERNEEKAERQRKDENAERERSDEKAERERNVENWYGGACSGASEFNGTAERELVSGPFVALEQLDGKQRRFAVRAARQRSADLAKTLTSPNLERSSSGFEKPPEGFSDSQGKRGSFRISQPSRGGSETGNEGLQQATGGLQEKRASRKTSGGFVVVTDLKPCTEFRIWLVRRRGSTESVTCNEGSSSEGTEPEPRAAEPERREAEQEGRGKGLKQEGAERPFPESERRAAEPEPEWRASEVDWQEAVKGVRFETGATKAPDESLEEDLASGVDGTERERKEATERKRDVGRGVREVTLQAGRLPSGSLVGQPGSDRPAWILRLLPADLADVDWVVIETVRDDESPRVAGPVLFAQLLEPGEWTLQLGWRDLLTTLFIPQVLSLPEGHSLWTDVATPLPLSLLPLTVRLPEHDCTAGLRNEGGPDLGSKGTCSAPCSPPLVVAWDSTIEEERIWTATNMTTLLTDGSLWGGVFRGQTNPPFVFLSDPRCGYRLSVTIAPHLACFRFVATNALRIVSFTVALVLFILAVQSHLPKTGDRTPSPIAVLCQLLTLPTTLLTLQTLPLGLQTPLLTLQTRVNVSLVALVLAAVLVPLSHSLEAARALRVTSADVYLLTSPAVAMSLAVGLVSLLAVAQAGLLRFIGWSVQRFRCPSKVASTGRERKRHRRPSGTARFLMGCLSVAVCFLVHPAIALLVVLGFQTFDMVSNCCRNRDQGERRTLVKEPSTDDRSALADGVQTGKTGVATAVPRGSTGCGHVSEQDQCGAALQRQSCRLLLAFLNFVLTAPSGFASLPRVVQRWRAPSVFDSLLGVAPIAEALLLPYDRSQGGRYSGGWISQTVRSYMYMLLGAYTCYESLVDSPLGVAPVFACAALVEMFLS